ncbi:hypothetical protein JG687_00006169 [Phytophthora cactorum]|uniref:Uncharacterized protein n=1 Tax=Phytophthora cactorum TaxID=29920 RepID=A0A329RPJ2_9STRA|nr:hypothetical protein PC112_g12088 [Phytophthora cactorum]KAG2914946.1 hypothetical protein PC115_g11546 [Phytophthora cactorum]KAG3012169.1 hypothetical protein PC119_g12954 [Phytophthora cactorum]KAG3015757.1 hypothetical protein PC120_g11992 [Phytophthora cactorum]KAG3218681.1 hypothetical protein PC129_g10498 [Phytophthora cactorum]
MSSFPNPPPRGEMVTLYCAIVGAVASVFEVEINDAKRLFLAKAKRKGEAEEEKGDDNKKWLAQIDALKGVKDTSGYKELTIPDAKVRVVGLASDGLGEVSDEGGAAGRGPAHVLVEIPSDIDVKKVDEATALIRLAGPKVNLVSCDDLLKFLEGEMIQRDRVISSPRILDDASSLNDLKQYVDNTMFDTQAWQSREIFAACFYAVRIKRCWCLGIQRSR